ncbi:MAG: undecaprenyl-diphosphate phosphatase [Thermodesulfovibrionales bacterium]
MIEAIILGITQGFTEFFPISSTAHLILLPWFFGWGGDVNTLTFDVALHGGTLTALIFCFWKDWVELFSKKQKLLFIIIISSIPAGIAGFLLNDIVEKKLREPFLISIMLILVGLIMLASESSMKKKGIEDINLKDAIFIGIAQATALIPGVSRSGITISSGMFKGLKRDASARFSFLLSTPIIAGATALHLKKFLILRENYDLQLFAAGFVTSSITGLIAIKFLLSFLRKYPLNLFVYYRFTLAVVIIAGIWLRG